MPKRSCVGYALKVNDLAASIAFYAERLGWTLAEEQPGTDRTVILDPDDHSPSYWPGRRLKM
jgi:catechol 2,3-dioxygenase-like lactoylglutathione lyase family enzyme